MMSIPSFPTILTILAAVCLLNLLSVQAEAITVFDPHTTSHVSSIEAIEHRNERLHARDIATTTADPVPLTSNRPIESATKSQEATSSTDQTLPSTSSTPLSDVPYTNSSDGSSITLAIIVSIIGGALLLTLAGWAWRKQKAKKSFGPSDHDSELAKHKIQNAGAASSGAGRHYSRDMVQVEGVPHQRSPTASRYSMNQ